MERATTQEQAMRRNFTIKASRETHMSTAAPADAIDSRTSYDLRGGIRGGYLSDVVLNPCFRTSYAVYPSVKILPQVYPAPCTFTWAKYHKYPRRKLPVPSVWSREATSFYRQLEQEYQDAMESDLFPCSINLLPPKSSIFPTFTSDFSRYWVPRAN